MATTSGATLEKITALCKRRGFVYPSADLYSGINGIYDFGPLGTLLKHNIRAAWLASVRAAQDSILLFEGALLAPEIVWQASGHVENFHDPLVDCLSCKHRYRADDIDLHKACPHCGNRSWTEVRQFNMMFKTALGAVADTSHYAYLRPETAQSIFINFKNIMSSNRIKIPFGVAQIGKAFRNEITPKQFLFRMREFEQMELEWFCHPDQSAHDFTQWREARFTFYTQYLELNKEKIRLRDHTAQELSHYSQNTCDVEYNFPFGWKELEGIAHRGNFDLSQHSTFSGKDLSVYDEHTKTSYIPHVVETSVGCDRLFLTLLFDAYQEDMVEGETRIVLRLAPRIAPIKAAFLPLTKHQSEKMHALYHEIRKTGLSVEFDETGSIGKRYRRQDEIGTPLCFTYDTQSEQDNTVTVRNRDTMQQERIAWQDVEEYVRKYCR